MLKKIAALARRWRTARIVRLQNRLYWAEAERSLWADRATNHRATADWQGKCANLREKISGLRRRPHDAGGLPTWF